MTQPDFLNTTICPYRWLQTAGITDAATLITDIRAELVTGLSWTEPSTALFKSPSNDGGQWMDILLTRISATVLEMRVRDHLGRTICTRRITLDATTTVNYYTGKFYMIIDALRATSEVLQATLLNMAPLNDGDYQNIVYAAGYRDNASGADGQGDNCNEGFMWEDTGAVFRSSRGTNAFHDTANTQRTRFAGSGNMVCEDVGVQNLNSAWSATTLRPIGRLWHAYLVDSTVALQADKVIGVSDAASATFRVIGLAIAAGTSTSRIAVRRLN